MDVISNNTQVDCDIDSFLFFKRQTNIKKKKQKNKDPERKREKKFFCELFFLFKLLIK